MPANPMGIPSDIKPEVDQILEAILYLYTESRRVTKELARSVAAHGAAAHGPEDARGAGGPVAVRAVRAHPRAEQHRDGDHRPHGARGAGLRARSTEDRRVVKIRLTDKGSRIAREVSVEPMEIFRGALESLSAAEMKDLLKILTKIARRVQSIVKREVPGSSSAKE